MKPSSSDPLVLLFFGQKTDISEYSLDALSKSRVKRVVTVGRRGPLQVAFTIKELREMITLPKCRTVIDPQDVAGINERINGMGERAGCFRYACSSRSPLHWKSGEQGECGRFLQFLPAAVVWCVVGLLLATDTFCLAFCRSRHLCSIYSAVWSSRLQSQVGDGASFIFLNMWALSRLWPVRSLMIRTCCHQSRKWKSSLSVCCPTV